MTIKRPRLVTTKVKVGLAYESIIQSVNRVNCALMCGYCSCMVGISQTRNHVAAALFRIEAAVRMGLTNPSCTSKPFEWLPNKSVVKATTTKRPEVNTRGLWEKRKDKAELNCSPKESYTPNIDEPCNLTFTDVS